MENEKANSNTWIFLLNAQTLNSHSSSLNTIYALIWKPLHKEYLETQTDQIIITHVQKGMFLCVGMAPNL